MPTPPSRGGVSSPFGMRVNPNDGIYRMHYGEDTLGAGNYAPVTGTVVFAGYDRTGTGLGWCVGIRQASDLSVIWWVAHHGTKNVSVNPLLVAVGQHVTEAETYLGPKGESGAAQGVHCHTERRVDGAARPGSGIATNPRNYYTAAAGGDATPFEPERTARRNTMSLYHKQGTAPTLYALAGDSPGTPANWLETMDQTLANQWSAQIGGPSAGLSAGSWDNFKTQYLMPLATSGGGSGGLTTAQDAALMGLPVAVADLPTNGELGQALTSTVALVNEHADGNKADIIAAIPQGGSGGASPYSLSIEIDSVPGTATGTATPA